MLRQLIASARIRSASVHPTGETLDDVLAFAVEHVPYYRQFRGYRSLRDFPILTKATIRNDLRELLSDDLGKRKWSYNTSGGSTGEPARFVQDEEYRHRTCLAVLETKRWAGYRPGDRLLKLWGNRAKDVAARSPRATVSRWLSNRILLDTFSLDEETIDRHVQIIRSFSPKLVVGFASSLYEISKHILARQAPLTNVSAVVSTAGTLFPEMRDIMEAAFGCRVFNRYGSSEVSIIAAEDGNGVGLRVAPTVHVETLRPDGSPCEEGESGEIAVTSLANYAMPLIRFRIGDVGTLRVRNDHPYFETVLGRTVELFKTKTGQRIDGQYFIQGMYYRDWISKFRFRQVDYDYIVIEVVPRSAPPADDLLAIEARIRHKMGRNVRIEWDYPEDIKPLPSGKYLYTTCEVP